MLSLRNRFGIPGVISVIALVFAMFGGAYAANDSGSGDSKANASAKAKKGPRGPKAKKGPRGPRGPKGPKGPAGPAGPVGPAGPAGAKGDTGAAGANGKDGTNGTSATTASFAGSKGTCTEGQGGLEVKSASPTAFVCNGKEGEEGEEGSPWTAGGTLPSGETLTGAWSAGDGGAGNTGFGFFIRTGISFPIPLPAELGVANTHFVTLEKQENEEVPAACTVEGVEGSAADPRAGAGSLCVYLGDSNGGFAFAQIFKPYGENEGAGATGAEILVAGGQAVITAKGTFAVTAP